MCKNISGNLQTRSVTLISDFSTSLGFLVYRLQYLGDELSLV